jgi:hypothetical protein
MRLYNWNTRVVKTSATCRSLAKYESSAFTNSFHSFTVHWPMQLTSGPAVAEKEMQFGWGNVFMSAVICLC